MRLRKLMCTTMPSLGGFYQRPPRSPPPIFLRPSGGKRAKLERRFEGDEATFRRPRSGISSFLTISCFPELIRIKCTFRINSAVAHVVRSSTFYFAATNQSRPSYIIHLNSWHHILFLFHNSVLLVYLFIITLPSLIYSPFPGCSTRWPCRL